jgi:hypothetical protein
MALQSGQLTIGITASQLTFALTNLSTNAQAALPNVGALPQPYGVPMLMDSEFMYVISQPVLGTVTVRARGTESAAVAHDTLCNVYFSNTPGDFQVPQAGTTTTIDPAEDSPITIGQDQTVVLPGATAVFNINKATAAAIVLPAPSFGDNGVAYTFTSNTAAAHVITATSLINDGTTSSPRTTATFTAAKGASVVFVVENGLYNVTGSPLGVTFS